MKGIRTTTRVERFGGWKGGQLCNIEIDNFNHFMYFMN